MTKHRKNPPISVSTTPWTDKAVELLLKATDYGNRASLFTPAVLSLLATVVAALERDQHEGLEVDLEILGQGRDLLREYARKDPAAWRVSDV